MKTNGKEPLSLVLFGGSSGSMPIFEEILRMAKRPLVHALIFVLHRSKESKALLPDLFRSKTDVFMSEPEHLDPIASNCIYFACPDYHLLVGHDSRFYYDHSDKDFFSRPSIDATFLSAAVSGIPVKAAMLFSGSSADGAHGLKELAERGSATYVQSPEEAEFPRMPAAALQLYGGHQVLINKDFANTINDIFNSRST